MDALELLDELEDIIDKGASVPFSGRCLLERDELLDVLQELKLKLPEDLKQAKWIKEERQRILQEAQAEADEIIKTVEKKAVSMVDENEITRQAYEQAAVVENETRNNIAQMKSDFNQYVNDMLNELENHLDVLVKKVQEDKINFNNN